MVLQITASHFLDISECTNVLKKQVVEGNVHMTVFNFKCSFLQYKLEVVGVLLTWCLKSDSCSSI